MEVLFKSWSLGVGFEAEVQIQIRVQVQVRGRIPSLGLSLRCECECQCECERERACHIWALVEKIKVNDCPYWFCLIRLRSRELGLGA